MSKQTHRYRVFGFTKSDNFVMEFAIRASAPSTARSLFRAKHKTVEPSTIRVQKLPHSSDIFVRGSRAVKAGVKCRIRKLKGRNK